MNTESMPLYPRYLGLTLTAPLALCAVLSSADAQAQEGASLPDVAPTAAPEESARPDTEPTDPDAAESAPVDVPSDQAAASSDPAAPAEDESIAAAEDETAAPAKDETAAPAQEGIADSGAGAESSEDIEAEAAVLEAELAAGDSGELIGHQRELNLYGFADFTYRRNLGGLAVDEVPTFSVGNLNLYLSADLGSGWRSLTEVRFMYLPHGPGAFGSEAISTETADYAEVNRPLRWGGVEIERAWVEYQAHELLTLRAGQWLTPYGIWNVDHGSPAIIGTTRPYVIGEALLPERQTGIKAHGKMYVKATQFGYHLTLSNGRGPFDSYMDMDKNKAIGGRLTVQNSSLAGKLALGISGYKGRFSVTEGDGMFVPLTIPEQYDELALAADLRWEWEGLHLQSEAIVQDVAYTDEGRPVADSMFGQPAEGFAVDQRRWGTYGLLGYRTPWWGIMPYASADYYKRSSAEEAGSWSAGINWAPVPAVVLKAQFKRVLILSLPGGGTDHLDSLELQVAWSF